MHCLFNFCTRFFVAFGGPFLISICRTTSPINRISLVLLLTFRDKRVLLVTKGERYYVNLPSQHRSSFQCSFPCLSISFQVFSKGLFGNSVCAQTSLPNLPAKISLRFHYNISYTFIRAADQ